MLGKQKGFKSRNSVTLFKFLLSVCTCVFTDVCTPMHAFVTSERAKE